MIRPLIHIGYHKTGTSWLQRELFGRKDRGFFPIACGKTYSAAPTKWAAKLIIHARPFDFEAEVIRAMVMSNTDWSCVGCPVISHERLSGNPHSGGYDSKELAERLHATFPEGAILIIVREQVSMILSCYHQYLKVGGACSLEDYIYKSDGMRPSFSLAQFRYHELIGHYQRLFGSENVLILPYEMLCRSPKLFIERLAKFADTDIPPDLPFNVHHNVSLDKLIETKTRWLNQFVCRNSLNGFSPLAPERTRPMLQSVKQRLSLFVPRAGKLAFERSQRKRISKLINGYFVESNRITSEITDIDLRAFGYSMSENDVV